MTTYYKINGQYVTYQQAHDLGYTMEATADQDYKSAGSNDWGEWLNSGFYDGLDGDLVSGSFFIEGETGWVDINALALRGYFPNEAETLTMHNVNDGRESNAAKLESGGGYYYLVQADLNLGWISEDDLPDTGWQEGAGSAAFCGNFTTEDDVMSSDVAGGQGYLPTYLVVTPLYESRGWDGGGNFRDGLTSITVLLGLRYDGNDWLSKTFDADDFWWSGILSEEDKTLIESIGLRTSVMFYGFGGQIGSIEYNAGYTYEILGLYSDIDGTQQVQTDLSNLFVAPHIPTGDTKQYACICNHTAITTPSMTWKVRITKN